MTQNTRHRNINKDTHIFYQSSSLFYKMSEQLVQNPKILNLNYFSVSSASGHEQENCDKHKTLLRTERCCLKHCYNS